MPVAAGEKKRSVIDHIKLGVDKFSNLPVAALGPKQALAYSWVREDVFQIRRVNRWSRNLWLGVDLENFAQSWYWTPYSDP